MAEATKRTYTKKTTAAPKEAAETAAPAAEKTYTKAELDAMIAAAVQQAIANYAPAPLPAQTAGDSVVTVLFIAEVSKENQLELPGYGAMRPNSYLEIPKKEFGGKFMSPLARLLIDKRHILVVDGLTKDERIRWNCDYKDGEVLSERVFDHMLDYDTAQLCDIVSHLCDEHKRFVCRRITQARVDHDNRLSLDRVKAVNALTTHIVEGGLLQPVIEDFAKELVKK